MFLAFSLKEDADYKNHCADLKMVTTSNAAGHLDFHSMRCGLPLKRPHKGLNTVV